MHYPVINDKIKSVSHAISSPKGIFHANLNCKQKGIPKLLGEVFLRKSVVLQMDLPTRYQKLTQI